MQLIHAHSVNHALAEGIRLLTYTGEQEFSRNGTVLVASGPVCTTYHNPMQRVLFSPTRDANPFFHLFEALWMLLGRNDVKYPARFAKQLLEYSDDGKTLWGAYGWRWREFFGYDQLNAIVEELKKNPNSRRCVLSMWSPVRFNEDDDMYGPTKDWEAGFESDLHLATSGGKDVPCNTHAYFDCRGGKLNMTVCCRSNDAIWGAYGANAVHFSVLLEYMAARIGIPVGVYRQISNNFHIYTDVFTAEKLWHIANESENGDYYNIGVSASAIITPDTNMDDWHRDLKRFVTLDGMGNQFGWNTQFFGDVARPMFLAHEAYSEKRYDAAEEFTQLIAADDWRTACVEWLLRREDKRKEKAGA